MFGVLGGVGEGGGQPGILPRQEGDGLAYAEGVGQRQDNPGKEVREASLGNNAKESRKKGSAQDKIFKARPQKGDQNDSPDLKISHIEKISQGEDPVGVDVTFVALPEA